MLVHEFGHMNSNFIFSSISVLAKIISQISLRINSYYIGIFQNCKQNKCCKKILTITLKKPLQSLSSMAFLKMGVIYAQCKVSLCNHLHVRNSYLK